MSREWEESVEVDMRRLRVMLRRALGDDAEQVKRALAKKEEARILDVACGACHEAETLSDFLAELREEAVLDDRSDQAKINFTGIDVRAREISDAARRFGKGIKEGSREFEFLNGDATRLDEHRELGSDFDLVFMRHQNYWNGARDWEQIYDQALEKVAEDGRLIITSYFDREHQLALNAIQRLGGELIRSEANEESRELYTPGKSIDRHVAVFRVNR